MLALRLIYEENMERLGLEQDAVCTVRDVLEKVVTDYPILSAKPNMEEVKRALTLLENHSIIQRIEGKFNQNKCRLAIPSTLIDRITEIDLKCISAVTFIENKTNYDEYLLSEKQQDELVVYHGGFLSPQRKKFFSVLAAGASDHVTMRFWADIDLGGFCMFEQLQKIVPTLMPMRMDSKLVGEYHEDGLPRSKQYLQKLNDEILAGHHLMFEDAMKEILKYGVTIEQEVMLD